MRRDVAKVIRRLDAFFWRALGPRVPDRRRKVHFRACLIQTRGKNLRRDSL